MITNEDKKLALFGGKKTILEPFKKYNSIGKEESDAVKKVMDSGLLSKYLGKWGEDFWGSQSKRI